ncbi:hypothetical protein NY536_30170, partial [Enterobacter hormaechei]|nr:hypothetical protein [Enterobacter hormaechei]
GECLTGCIETRDQLVCRHVPEDGEQPMVTGTPDRGRAALFGKGRDEDTQQSHRNRLTVTRLDMREPVEIEHRDRYVLPLGGEC